MEIWSTCKLVSYYSYLKILEKEFFRIVQFVIWINFVSMFQNQVYL